jgi:hypothetical protein
MNCPICGGKTKTHTACIEVRNRLFGMLVFRWRVCAPSLPCGPGDCSVHMMITREISNCAGDRHIPFSHLPIIRSTGYDTVRLRVRQLPDGRRIETAEEIVGQPIQANSHITLCVEDSVDDPGAFGNNLAACNLKARV